MKRTAPPMLVLVTCFLGIVGCAAESSGNASADDPKDWWSSDGSDVTQFPETSSAAPTASSPQVESGTAALQPCELLTAEDLAALGLPSLPRDKGPMGPARHCQWQTSGSHTVSVGVTDDLDIDQVQSEKPPAPLAVGSHDAVQYVGLAGTCGVAIAVTDSSRVDVLRVAGGDMTKACNHANQAAELVETKLP